MDWALFAVLLGSGAICGAVMRLPSFVVALLAAAFIVILASWPQGAGAAVLRAAITVAVVQGGYAGGILLRSLLRALRERRAAPGKLLPPHAVQLPNEPKRR